jgi:hypothetical protein
MEISEARQEHSEERKEQQGYQFVLLGNDQRLFPNFLNKDVVAKLF